MLPQKEIKPQEVGRWYMDTGGIDWDFDGAFPFRIIFLKPNVNPRARCGGTR